MSSPAEQRKLAAIMFTDMVGYSALSQRDDKLALELLEEHRELLRKIFPQFNGTEIKTIGDAFLVEFNSALEAAQCAIEIQRALAHRNADAATDHQIELKIGIHIGDVVHRDGDVYGDGVNIASRIEPLAGAGGICISMDVERQIRNAVETRFEKLAPTELKNISVPMELFRIVLPWERVAGGRKSEIGNLKSEIGARSVRSKWIWAASAVVLLVIIVVGWWWSAKQSLVGTDRRAVRSGEGEGSRQGGTTSLPIPEKSIAVLPFDNLSRDPDNAYFAEGIQDEILTRLSKVAALKVISRTSTQKYKSAPDNLREIGQQLGVANVLEGSVQKIANAAHINVQLIRASTDEHVWAESYNRKLDDVFAVEGEVASAIAEQLNAKLTGAEQKALNDKPTQNPVAYDAYLRGISIEQSRTDDAAQREALASYTAAVRLDPKFALAWARLAVLRSDFYFGGVDLATNSAATVKEAADEALTLQPQLGEAFVAQGVYRYRVLRDFRGALESYSEALKRLPNSALVLGQMGHVERRLGQWDAAEKSFRSAVELDPRNLDSLSNLAQVLEQMRKFPEAQATWDRMLQISPNDEVVLAAKAWGFQDEGRLDEAAPMLAKIRENSPNIYVNATKFFQLLLERRFEGAITFIQSSANRDFTDDPRTITYLGLCQELAGRKDDARATFARAVASMKPTPQAVVPVDGRFLPSFLALAYAGLGENAKALEQAKRVVADYKDDAESLPFAEEFLAIIEADSGDLDSAIAAVPHLLEVPSSQTRARMRIDPVWDPLRKDPRFQKLCEEPNK
ncbi:MAG TPA: adenylate/guanylate cyclase domain-containing protein [Chthoniobacterales bacterium]|nr:adenylate/guanylate cyclase domain-containing protein [Chthoniobacterales bacterium]